jgi:hypothetical protein
MGHKGCGKSTELNKMADDLKDLGYDAIIIQCASDIDLINPLFSDLLILMGDALIRLAEERDCYLEPTLRKTFASYWQTEIEETFGVEKGSSFIGEAGLGAGTPSFLSGIMNVFAIVKAVIRFNADTRVTYREKIRNSTDIWLDMLIKIAVSITENSNGKQPILIFEDIDKITNLDEALNIFINHASALTGLPFPVIYTYPIALAYDTRFAALKGLYVAKTLPMIKIENVGGGEFKKGLNTIKHIVEKRADLSIFDKNVLAKLIKKTGGSLRDLFICITNAAKFAVRKGNPNISMQDADIALNDLKSSLTKTIESSNYAFLADICTGNRRSIEDKAMLLDMLKGNIVFEYNASRWNNVHPLVTDFLNELGEIKKMKIKKTGVIE